MRVVGAAWCALVAANALEVKLGEVFLADLWKCAAYDISFGFHDVFPRRSIDFDLMAQQPMFTATGSAAM